jgi:hypothetical protein
MDNDYKLEVMNWKGECVASAGVIKDKKYAECILRKRGGKLTEKQRKYLLETMLNLKYGFKVDVYDGNEA